MYQLRSPYIQYSSNTWAADNLRIPDNGRSSLHEVIQFHRKNVPNNGPSHDSAVSVANHTLQIVIDDDQYQLYAICS